MSRPKHTWRVGAGERVGSRRIKPAFQALVDLGLRDVGIRNDRRRLALTLGTTSIQLFVLACISAFVLCTVAAGSDTGAAIFAIFVPAWLVLTVLCVLWMANRLPLLVVKVDAEGTNQATWLMVALSVLVAVATLATAQLVAIPMVVLMLASTAIVWRARGRVPDVLRRLRAVLAEDETVLGDGAGVTRWTGNWRDSFRLVVATDRRLLVTGSTRSTAPFPLVDVPYDRVMRFGIEWKHWGRVGTLSLTVAGTDGGAPSEHVVSGIAPANLVSIASALRSHGVPPDDGAVVAEAELAWEDARRPSERGRPLDEAAMNTPEFDRGMWLLLALSALVFYVNPLGVGIGDTRNGNLALLAVPLVCGICGYVARNRAAFTYLAPLNLLSAPAFFFWDADYVIGLMVSLTLVGAVGLWAGSALAAMTYGRASAAAAPAAAPRPVRGTLRYTLGGVGLVRLSAMMLGALLALVLATAAAGFELTSVRLAIDELTGKQLPVDGRSDLTGGAAYFRYTPDGDLREFNTDSQPDPESNHGSRWELRSKFTQGHNVVSLAYYRFDPPLRGRAAVADFLDRKDREHSALAGFAVTHTTHVFGGRKAYIWNHESDRGYWYYAAWFPRSHDRVRVECVARRQKAKFQRLCKEALDSLRFRE
jgi:hypothetical protein